MRVSDDFQLPSLEIGTKPICLQRWMTVYGHRAAISDVMKRGLAISNIGKTISIFPENYQGLESFASPLSYKWLPNCYKS